MRTLCVIPARLGSSRLPNKALLAVGGKPLVVRTIEAALRCPDFGAVALVTDHLRVGQEAMIHFYASGAFPNPPLDVAVIEEEFACGTDRVADYVRRMGESASQWDCIVNLQADEPEITPEALSTLVATLSERKGCGMATLVADDHPTDAELDSPDCVQVLTELGYGGLHAIEFSRQPRAHRWHGRNHIGAYAFTSEALETFAQLPRTADEIRANLEQLRWLGHGGRIATAYVAHNGGKVDTPEDYAALISRFDRNS